MKLQRLSHPMGFVALWLVCALAVSVTIASPAAALQVNQPPVIVNPGDLVSNVGQYFSGRPSASDRDGDLLTFQATGLPTGTIMAPDGLVTGTTAVAGTFVVTVTVEDGNGGSDSMTLTWTVNGDGPATEPSNRAPVVQDPGDQASDVGDRISGRATASDPDGDALIFTAAGLPTGLLMADDGLVTGTITAAGSYMVIVTVDDGNGGTDSVAVAWEVTGEEPPVGAYDAPGDLVVPQPLPFGEPGQLIDTEVLNVAGSGYRMLYHSRSATNDDVAVSGFVRLPAGQAPAGGWPLIAWAHGTVGLADVCAPSIYAEFDSIANALNNYGYAVVATDYEGLGTPGLHPYIVGSSAAHAVLDSVRAVANLDLDVSNEWLTLGFSQGGHAALFTSQLQPTYAPELDLIGAIAAAPPSQLEELQGSIAGSNFQGYLVMVAAGLAAAYDDLDIADRLTPQAIDLLDVMETGCIGEVFDTYNPIDYDDLVTADPFTIPGWAQAELAQDTNQLPTATPLLIVHGGDDYQVATYTSAMLLSQLCAFPTQPPAARIVYPGENHNVLPAAASDIIAWADARFAGQPAPDQC